MNVKLPTNWNEAAAAGKHYISIAGGIVTGAAAYGLISNATQIQFTEGLNALNQLVLSLTTLAGLVAGGYMSLKAAFNASPSSQVKAVAETVKEVEDPAVRNKLINTVATMPEVKGVVAEPSVAQSTSSSKVVADPVDIKGA